MMLPKDVHQDEHGQLWQRGHNVLSKITSSIYKHEDAPPPITRSAAISLTLLFTVLYVAPFYLSKALRSTTPQTRNSPQSIKARTRSVALTCLITTLITTYVLNQTGHVSPAHIPTLLGLWPVSIFDILRTQALITVLFLAPLYESGIVDRNYRFWFQWRHFRATVLDDWCAWRNLVVGPVSEEYIFRGLSISLFLLARVPARQFVYLSPMIFGLAHVHHFNESILAATAHAKITGRDQSYLAALCTPSVLVPALLRATVQFTYTSVFGVFETFLLVRTGNLYACVLTHVFCNWIGLPRFWGRLSAYRVIESSRSTSGDGTQNGAASAVDDAGVSVDKPDLADDTGDNKKSDHRAPSAAFTAQRDMQDQRQIHTAEVQIGLQWTVAYYMLLVIGAAGFYKLLWPWTESRYALTRF